MTSLPDRHRILKLVEEAQSQGARRAKVCDLLGISARTLSRWKDDTGKIVSAKESARWQEGLGWGFSSFSLRQGVTSTGLIQVRTGKSPLPWLRASTRIRFVPG